MRVAEYPGKQATHGMTGGRSYCGWIWPAIAVKPRKGRPSEVTCKVCRRAMVARGLLSNTRIPYEGEGLYEVGIPPGDPLPSSVGDS